MAEEEKKLSSFQLLLLQYFKFITPLTVVLILVFSFIFLLKPQYNKVRVSGALNLEAKQESLNNKKDHLSQLKELAENYSGLSAGDIIKVEKILPREEDIPGVLAQLEKLAVDNGFNILSLDINSVQSLSRDKQQSLVKKLSLSLAIEGGDYASLKLFLDQLENNLRLFDVESLNFTAGSGLYTLNISTYFSFLK